MVDDCLFCKIVAGEIPATKVIEDEHTLTFTDIDPKAADPRARPCRKQVSSADPWRSSAPTRPRANHPDARVTWPRAPRRWA